MTVVFASVDSTRRADALDPEARRRLDARCLGDMRAVLERHGATVEAYPGDAVLAVFGLPVLHEDDALRALRAAAGIRESSPGSPPSSDERSAPAHHCAPGSAPARWSAGRPIRAAPARGHAARTLAKRPEETAAGDPASSRATPPRTGRRATSSTAGPARLGLARLSPRAGAEPDRASSTRRSSAVPSRSSGCSSAVAAAVADRTCHLVTVLGAAGVGKSRLVDELRRRAWRARCVLRGRCLPYGEGITYWPLAEVVRDLIGAEGDGREASAREAIAARLADDPKAELIACVLADARRSRRLCQRDERGDLLGGAPPVRGAARATVRS